MSVRDDKWQAAQGGLADGRDDCYDWGNEPQLYHQHGETLVEVANACYRVGIRPSLC